MRPNSYAQGFSQEVFKTNLRTFDHDAFGWATYQAT